MKTKFVKMVKLSKSLPCVAWTQLLHMQCRTMQDFNDWATAQVEIQENFSKKSWTGSLAVDVLKMFKDGNVAPIKKYQKMWLKDISYLLEGSNDYVWDMHVLLLKENILHIVELPEEILEEDRADILIDLKICAEFFE